MFVFWVGFGCLVRAGCVCMVVFWVGWECVSASNARRTFADVLRMCAIVFYIRMMCVASGENDNDSPRRLFEFLLTEHYGFLSF